MGDNMTNNAMKALKQLWYNHHYSGHIKVDQYFELSADDLVSIVETKPYPKEVGNMFYCSLSDKGKQYCFNNFEKKSKMEFDSNTKTLKSANGELIKIIDCPIKIDCVDLKPVSGSLVNHYCDKCNKNVLNINDMTCEQVKAIVQYDPNVCFSFDSSSKYIDFKNEHEDLRVIYTARTIEVMNEAIELGFKLLIKPVENRNDIGETIILEYDDIGKINIRNECYQNPSIVSKKYKFWYKKCRNEFPFAAYLIPSDIKKGEEVWIDDLIEDFKVQMANYNDISYRKTSAKAIWNGEDFYIDSQRDEGPFFIG